jgi:2-haloacid dehalogenase
MNFEQYSALTFDCYGTLMDWETGILTVLHNILALHGAIADDSTVLTLYGAVEAEAESGPYRPYRDVLADVVRGIGQRLGFSPSAVEADSLAQSIATWQPFKDTVPSLRQLKSRYRLAIISNIDDDLFATTAPKLGVDLDEVVTAGQAHAYKPSLKLFNMAIERLGIEPNRILHVGQSLYHDAVPAKSLGMGTVWVNRHSKRPGVGAVKSISATPDLEVADLATLVQTIFSEEPSDRKS